MGAEGAAVRRRRPSREEIEPAALELIARYGAHVMGTARRYSASPEDAEDAYQRALEILLTKAPSTRESDLLPWLKTVVKHEAFALRRQRERNGQPTEYAELAPAAGPAADTHEHVERYERLQHGAEAMQRLKPQEVRALLLLAEGHSYHEICEITGWTYTKVNRCLAEGRRSFMQRIDGIESGAECERIEPLLSAFADGEANEADSDVVRRHLRTCLACRASLRETRAAPLRVAALAPAGALVAGGHGTGWHPLHAIAGWLHDRATLLAMRGQDLVEVASAQKVAAVAASAAIAGSGVAVVETTAPAPHNQHAHHARVVSAPAKPTARVVRVAPPPAAPPRQRRARPRVRPEPAAAPAPIEAAPKPQPEPARPAPTPTKTPPSDGAGEFGP